MAHYGNPCANLILALGCAALCAACLTPPPPRDRVIVVTKEGAEQGAVVGELPLIAVADNMERV
jgi:hypothetical protein